MAIIVSCPSCSRKLKAKDEQAGRRMKCPACLAIVTVPNADNSMLENIVPVKSTQCVQLHPVSESIPESPSDNELLGQADALSKRDAANSELLKRAEAGDTEAMREYAMMCGEDAKNSGGTDSESFHLAWEWLEKAAEGGNAKAQSELASGYRALDEMEKAFLWEEKSANQDFTEAQYNLAVCYQDGIGTPKNPEKEFYWYQRAANNGLTEAKHILGVRYILGKGTPQDFEKAAYWLRQAADEGHANAKTRLGSLYIQGMGIPEDREKGFALIREAAELGDERAKEILEEMKDENSKQSTSVSFTKTPVARKRYIETTPQYDIYIRALELLRRNGYELRELEQKKNCERMMIRRDSILYGEVFVVADPNFHIGCLGAFISILFSSIFSRLLKIRFNVTSYGIMRKVVEIFEYKFDRRDYGNVTTSYWPEDTLVGAVGSASVDYDDAWIHLIKPIINASPSWKNWLA